MIDIVKVIIAIAITMAALTPHPPVKTAAHKAPVATHAPARTAPVTDVRTKVATAKRYALRALGRTQYNCFYSLMQRESRWNPYATNRRSGAYGIPQALPGSKMRTAGADWRTNPTTQVKWGIRYVRARYGSACRAYRHALTTGWY